MSDRDILSLATGLEKKMRKWGVSLLLTILTGLGGICFTIGWVGSDWHYWRKSTDASISEIKAWKETVMRPTAYKPQTK